MEDGRQFVSRQRNINKINLGTDENYDVFTDFYLLIELKIFRI